MNCRRCHHTDQVHEYSDSGTSLLKVGSCKIPNCTCKQFVDSIQELDEDLI